MSPSMNHQAETEAQTDKQQAVRRRCVCSVLDCGMSSCKSKPEEHSGSEELGACCKDVSPYLLPQCLVLLFALVFGEGSLLVIAGSGHLCYLR